MRPVTLLIKPASSLCNLRCTYCFYHDVAKKRLSPSYGLMTEKTLEVLVRKVFQYAKGFAYFGFQGGEPTLVGLTFFEKLVELQKKYNIWGVKVINAIQTNGTHLNKNWAEFFHKNNFLVGISLDGPPNIHDRFRLNADGKGSFDKVMGAVKLMEKHEVEYNILCVVNNVVAENAARVYRFFKSNNIKYIQFIPCLNPFGDEHVYYDYTLTSENYLNFLKTTFDLWYEDWSRGTPISIRTFDNYVSMIAGYPPEACGMSGVCSCYFLVESDGSVYPCDFYVLDEYRLGNVLENSLEEMMETDTANAFVEESRIIHDKCKNCKWYRICRSGCKRNRDPNTHENLYCDAYYNFFEYAYDKMDQIANILKRQI
ncbi:MAG TPA: anaerobic sulfatase maturase [Clostridia bacterium]|nr:anaerobic sulfatase maturase [Clostridiaceae bacterium]HOA32158.1 anaerobic sulfatase maturase [Clostridia bacterium]HPZ53328.1 anaerobic sulfatase maturase [Clostridia bacterium]